jgi:segregation and condensation protein B
MGETVGERVDGAVEDTVDGGTVDGGTVDGATVDGGTVDGGTVEGAAGQGEPANALGNEPAELAEPVDERDIDLDHLEDAGFEDARLGDASGEAAPTAGGPAGGPPTAERPAGEGAPSDGSVTDGPVATQPGYLEQRRAIEAVLMVAESPVEPTMLAQLLEMSPATVDQICDDLARSYRDDQRGFELARVAGGYRFQSHPEMAPYIERFVLEGQSARLSAAALESLAIVAYKQPISRAQVAAIRGVNSDGVLRTLCIRGYVTEVARDPGPGQALLYGTTTLLLERLGLDKIEDLPPLGDFVPGPEVMDALEQGLRP